jgi:hypothetical protein
MALDGIVCDKQTALGNSKKELREISSFLVLNGKFMVLGQEGMGPLMDALMMHAQPTDMLVPGFMRVHGYMALTQALYGILDLNHSRLIAEFGRLPPSAKQDAIAVLSRS